MHEKAPRFNLKVSLHVLFRLFFFPFLFLFFYNSLYRLFSFTKHLTEKSSLAFSWIVTRFFLITIQTKFTVFPNLSQNKENAQNYDC